MKKEDARKWAELFAAIAAGEPWQIKWPSGWVDAIDGHNPGMFKLNSVRIKPGPEPEPQRVYVVTWFDEYGKVRAMSMTAEAYEDPQRVLEKHYGDHTGFRLDVIDRELP